MSVDLTTILKHYGEVTLCVDFMYVNKVPLLVTLSRNIKFGTMEAVADRKEATILKCIKGVVTLYRKAGFTVTTALMDGEFVPLCGGLVELGLRLNETSRDEHIGDIERYIRTVKERMRATYNTLPFQKIPAASHRNGEDRRILAQRIPRCWRCIAAVESSHHCDRSTGRLQAPLSISVRRVRTDA